MMDPLEALADAIMQQEGWKLGSRSWRNRNPGNLRPYLNQIVPTDNGGYIIFESLINGFNALKNDLRAKLKGSHNLTPQSTILNLISIYAPAGDHNYPTPYTNFVCRWTTSILGRTILPTTTLEEFLGGQSI